MKRVLAAIVVWSGSASAEGYEDHAAVIAFTSGRCAEFVQIVDGEKLAASFLSQGPEETMRRIAENGMMWGVLLGYDTRAGGLHTPDKTTLERLRDACEAQPSRSAKSLLDEM